MRPIYLIKDHGSFQRKVMLDMAWLSSHKQIRLPKFILRKEFIFPISRIIKMKSRNIF